MKIIANCIIRNEDQWVWYAIHSVLPYVDRVLVYDTGSTDKSVEIIKSIKSEKIKFVQKKSLTPDQVTACRQEMWEASDADWILILDGDEIWTKKAMESSIQALDDSTSYIISTYHNVVGDVYHYQPKSAGRYQVGSYFGHLTIRWINKKKHRRIYFEGDYPLEALCVSPATPIQKDTNLTSKYIDDPYIHTTHLKRSSQKSSVFNRNKKFKFELGIPHPKRFEYPAAFYMPHDAQVPSPWLRAGLAFTVHALWQTPLRLIKRAII